MKPEFEVPASVAVDMVLLRTDEVAVTIGLLRVYSTGFEFTVDSRCRRSGHSVRIGGMPRRYASVDEQSEDGLRLGLEFSDGRRAEIGAPHPHPEQAESGALVVMSAGGGGSERSWHSRFWVYPLPPAGPLSFVAAWPAFGVTEVRLELEAEAILSAASRALVLWLEEPGAPRGEATIGRFTVRDA